MFPGLTLDREHQCSRHSRLFLPLAPSPLPGNKLGSPFSSLPPHPFLYSLFASQPFSSSPEAAPCAHLDPLCPSAPSLPMAFSYRASLVHLEQRTPLLVSVSFLSCCPPLRLLSGLGGCRSFISPSLAWATSHTSHPAPSKAHRDWKPLVSSPPQACFLYSPHWDISGDVWETWGLSLYLLLHNQALRATPRPSRSLPPALLVAFWQSPTSTMPTLLCAPRTALARELYTPSQTHTLHELGILSPFTDKTELAEGTDM